MLKRTNAVWAIVMIAVLAVSVAIVGTAAAQKAALKAQGKLALGEDEGQAIAFYGHR
jgi:hypothetical protein